MSILGGRNVMVPRLVVTMFLLGTAVEAAKGPMGLRVDGLGPVKLSVAPGAVPPGILPVGDQTEELTGLSSSERESLRARLDEIARKALESAGFEVVAPSGEQVPVFVVAADSKRSQCSTRSLDIEATVSVNEPAVWVRDPTKKGLLIVWKRAYKATVSRKDAAKSIEQGVQDGVNMFIAAQPKNGPGQP